MEEKINFAVVGIFVLVLSAGLIGGVLWFGSGQAYRTVYDVYLTYMSESVSGLNLNAPVRYRGVEIGRVTKIALAPGNVEQVQLRLAIERGTPVKVDTVAVLQVQGLTGLAFVELTEGRRASAALQKQADEPYPVIRAAPSLIRRLDDGVTALLANLNRSSENFNALMDEDNRRALKSTLADISTLSRTLAARSSTIDASLANAARTMENTARLSGELPQLGQRVQRSADAVERMANELPQLVQRVQRSADAVEHMANELARAGTSANVALGGTRQFTDETLPEIHRLALELRDLTGSLQRVSSELEQNPGALLYGKPSPRRGPGE